MNVKIIGAGSIGNHLAQAARRMGWSVTVTDTDPEALRRMKEEIYPKRYGTWDDSIVLKTAQEEPKGGFDIICLGTPPDVRMQLALAALSEKPKILQLEKPLCAPSNEGLGAFLTAYQAQTDTVALMGYDHAISESIAFVIQQLKEGIIGSIESLDVEFREHWQGIFSAHPWLNGPEDTYLGFWNRGGGASGEHSHALHLWYVLAKHAGIGKWKTVQSVMDDRKLGGAEYDAVTSFQILTEKGRVGRVAQDVVTQPPRKWARVQGVNGFIEWVCNGRPEGDLVRVGVKGQDTNEYVFAKKRPDDFYREMEHFVDIMNGKISQQDSPISLESGVAVMEVLHEAHKNQGHL